MPEPTPTESAGESPKKPLPAREAALRILSDLREGRQTARGSIDSLLVRYLLAPQDLSLATELVMGVVRHRLTLARVLTAVGRLRWKQTNHRLQDILLLGAYQLIWLDGVPAFAAVNEAVDQAKAEAGQRGAKFVNAILRQLLRQIEQRRLNLANADVVRAIPIDGALACQFREPVLCDPAREPQAHLAEATSNPLWMVSRWVSAFGMNKTRAICLANMSRPPLALRPNGLRTSARALCERLRGEGVEAEAASDGRAVLARATVGPTHLGAFREGLFQVQDRTSMNVILDGCGPRLGEGQVIVDLCAGLGTKATQAAEIMRNHGRILASDKDEGKLVLARSNAERLGISIIETVPADALPAVARELGRIDWIFIDAPCSNTGVLARRPEARYRLNPRRLADLTAIQLSLLDTAANLARQETRLLYSTCSLEPDENEELTGQFAATHPGWRIDASERVFPSLGVSWQDWRDGGYWAVWSRP